MAKSDGDDHDSATRHHDAEAVADHHNDHRATVDNDDNRAAGDDHFDDSNDSDDYDDGEDDHGVVARPVFARSDPGPDSAKSGCRRTAEPVRKPWLWVSRVPRSWPRRCQVRSIGMGC